MDASKLTTAQKAAVFDRDKDILVSASAGSGKTAVLVERVIKLLQENKDLRIDSMLLVTFTKEAAKNMRERIRKRLMNSADAHLKQQVNRVAVANISTIHSFCEQIIKRYYYVIGLDPQYRLLTDDTELHLLKEQVFKNLQEYFFGQEQEQQAFIKLSRNFADAKSNVGDGLADVVEKLYQEANAQPHPEEWLKGLVKNYELPDDDEWTHSQFFQTSLRPILVRRLQQDLADLQTNVDHVLSIDNEKTTATVQSDFQLVNRINDAIEDDTGWDELRTLINKKGFKRISGPKKSEEYDAIKARRDGVKADLDKLHKAYFELSNAQLLTATKAAKAIVEELVKVTIRYRQDYQKAKLQRHLLDFSDLEHYAFQILTDQTEDGLAVRKQLQRHFKEILVDEYQDTNRLQDELLNQLHDPQLNHMFMVGDVKQSIYRFRQADPTLFLEKGHRFAGNDRANEAISLADNFRSMNSVVDFTNLIFTQLMDQAVGRMPYDDKAKLKFGAKWYKEGNQPTEVMIYDANADNDDQAGAQQNGQDQKQGYVRRPEGADKLSGEIWMVGMRIRQMLDNQEEIYDPDDEQMRPIKPSDIVLLERNKDANSKIISQFDRLNIPVMVHDSKNFFKATEVRTIVSLLKIIDNPLQDIPLVAVLRSPIVGLTEPEMAFLKVHDRDNNFYHAVTSFVNNKHQLPLKDKSAAEIDQVALFDKLFEFLQELHNYQQIAQQEGLVKLIWQIYHTTGFLDYVGIMQGGAQRQANLHALYERAKTYEDSSFKGLYQFVHFIEWMQKQDEDLGEAPVKIADDAVNVMTIHGSKGLEFPIVFLINSNKGFNNTDTSSNLIVDVNQGIGLQYIGSSKIVNGTADGLELPTRYNLPQRTVIADTIQRDNKAEEMRLLYVALTRAEQRLIITGSVNENNRQSGLDKSWLRWEKALQSTSLVLDAQYRLNAKSMLDWIIACLVRTKQFDPQAIGQKYDQDGHYHGKFTDADFSLALYDADSVDDELLKMDKQRGKRKLAVAADHVLTSSERQFVDDVMNLNYQHKAAIATTPYQSVSAIKGLFVNQDPDDRSMGKLTYENGHPKTSGQYVDDDFEQPQFMDTDNQLSAPEIGTATHLVFQKLAVQNGQVNVQTVTDTISDLKKQGLIANDKLADAINVDGIVAFYQTQLGQEILAHPDQLYREQPFSMLMDGKDLFKDLQEDDGPILIHGIIDGYLLDKNGITLFDYKTDHLRPHNQSDLQKLVGKYEGQINLYAKALQVQTDLPVVKRYLYFVQTGQLYQL